MGTCIQSLQFTKNARIQPNLPFSAQYLSWCMKIKEPTVFSHKIIWLLVPERISIANIFNSYAELHEGKKLRDEVVKYL